MAVTVNKRLCESLLAWVLLALAGCGGGGGSSPVSTPAPTLFASSSGGVFN